MGQIYLQHFKYRGAVDKSAFDEGALRMMWSCIK